MGRFEHEQWEVTMIKDLARIYLEEEKKLLDSIALPEFEEILELIYNAYESDNRIFVFGNGGSSATASHFACDLNKGACSGLAKKFKVMCLNDNVPLLLAYANDVSYDDVFVEQLKNHAAEKDVVIGISGSGKSVNVLKAIRYSNDIGAISIGITGFDGGELALIAKKALIIRADDMQKVEDMHLVLTHMAMQILYKKIRMPLKPLSNRPI